MPIPTTQLDKDFKNAIADLPTTFTWTAVDYTGILTDLVKTEDLQPGGFLADFDARLHVRTAVFTGSRPNIGDKITISSVNYRIIRRTTTPDDVELILDLQTINK